MLYKLIYASICCATCVGASAVHAKAPTTDTLKIDVTASIAERCGVQALGKRTNDNARIDVATTLSFNFQLDCNTPFKIGVAAQHGALRLNAATETRQQDDGFAVAKQYDVALSFMTDQDGLVDAGECQSATINAANATCQFYGAQPGMGFSPGRHTTAIGREGALTISWVGEDGEPVRHAAGGYQETLTLVVAPRT